MTAPAVPLDPRVQAEFDLRVAELRDRVWLEIPEAVRLDLRDTALHVLTAIVPNISPAAVAAGKELGPSLFLLLRLYTGGPEYLSAALGRHLPELEPLFTAVTTGA